MYDSNVNTQASGVDKNHSQTGISLGNVAYKIYRMYLSLPSDTAYIYHATPIRSMTYFM